jgi:cell division initiation protein
VALLRGQRRYGHSTEKVLAQLTSDHEALVAEHAELRERVRTLEAELGRYRQQEQLVSNALVAAKQTAEGVREEARREAELMLRKARKHAERLARATSRRRERLEEETARLAQLNEATRSRLSAFLVETLARVSHPDSDPGTPAGPQAAADEEYASAEPI